MPVFEKYKRRNETDRLRREELCILGSWIVVLWIVLDEDSYEVLA